MPKLKIVGGRRLSGEIVVDGAKNSAVALIPASILCDETVEINNVPDISDIDAIKEIGEGWVAEEALAIALYSCLKYSNSFEDAIVCAVNHDGDSDSTGAIAGNIIGTYLGLSNIPKYYLKYLGLISLSNNLK